MFAKLKKFISWRPWKALGLKEFLQFFLLMLPVYYYQKTFHRKKFNMKERLDKE